MLVQVLADEGVERFSDTAAARSCRSTTRYSATTRNINPHALIGPANEQGAGFMAPVSRGASGRVGVALCVRAGGPTWSRRCAIDMAIPCRRRESAARCRPRPSAPMRFRRRPCPASWVAVAKHVFLITDPTKLEATVRTAFEIARTGRPGPVVLDVPRTCRTGKAYSTAPAACRWRVSGSG